MTRSIKTFEDFAREAQQYKTILREYKTSKKVFVDKNFDKDQIFSSDSTYKEGQWNWLPLDTYFSAPLFSPKLIKPEYIVKGQYGDESFISALARTARQPYLVRLLFDTKTPQAILGTDDDLTIDLRCGAVVIYFHAFGRKTPVLIDTTVPFKVGTMTPHISQPSNLNYSAWFTLVEKAYMKLTGVYSNRSCGLSRAIYSLFGYYSIEKEFSKFDTKIPLFQRLLDYQKQDCVMGATVKSYLLQGITTEEVRDLGLIDYVVYLIHKVRVEEGHELLCLQNLFDQDREWLGDWSDTSELWTPSLKKKLDMQEADDGKFWISSADFFKYFSVIEVCKPIHPNWSYYTFKVHVDPGPKTDSNYYDIFKSPPNQRIGYEVRLESPLPEGATAKFHVIVERKTNSDDNPMFGLLVIKGSSYNTNYSSSLLYQTKFEMTNSDKSVILALFRSGANSGNIEDCYIEIFSEADFEIYQENSSTAIPTIQKQKPKGFVFDNYSRNHNVAPRLKVENIDGEDYFTMTDELIGSVYENEDHNDDDDAFTKSFRLSSLKRDEEEMKRKAEAAEKRALELKKEKLRKERELERKKKEVDEQIAQHNEEKRRRKEEKERKKQEIAEQKRKLQAEIDAAKKRLRDEFKRAQAAKTQPDYTDLDLISSSIIASGTDTKHTTIKPGEEDPPKVDPRARPRPKREIPVDEHKRHKSTDPRAALETPTKPRPTKPDSRLKPLPKKEAPPPSPSGDVKKARPPSKRKERPSKPADRPEVMEKPAKPKPAEEKPSKAPSDSRPKPPPPAEEENPPVESPAPKKRTLRSIMPKVRVVKTT